METPIRAPRGATLRTRGWKQEAALRMLMNSVDPDVAESRPGQGHHRPYFHAIVSSLETLAEDETLLVESGKPAGVFQTRPEAPRVIIADPSPAGQWPADWMYIGTQGFLQAAYESFATAAHTHFGGSLAGKLVVSGGMGRMGGAQPLAATMNGAAFLGVEADPGRIKRRLRTGYCEIMVNSLDEAVRILRHAVRRKHATSVGLLGNCAEVLPEMVRRGIVPDLLTDQTSAHDSPNGYLPAGFFVEQAAGLRVADPSEYLRRSLDSIAVHDRAMLDLQKLGATVFDYAGSVRNMSAERGPFLWAALSGEPSDIAATDDLVCHIFPFDDTATMWIFLARKWVHFQGLPARACWLGLAERARFALEVNRLVASGQLKAPVVIGRGDFDCFSAASHQAATEGARHLIDAIPGRPMLNALLNDTFGASWVSVVAGADAFRVSEASVAVGMEGSSGGG